MKPTSVIFLILSLILIAGGVFTCIAATRIANERGVALFVGRRDKDNNVVESYNFGNETIRRISLAVDDCDITICGGSASSYVELVNFTRNTYTFSTSDNTLTVKDGIGPKSLFRTVGGSVEIYGLRYFLKSEYVTKEHRDKEIRIYLSGKQTIGQVEVTAAGGEITILQIPDAADYKLTMKNGAVRMRGIADCGTLNVSIGKGSFTLDTAGTNGIFDVDVEDGDISVTYPAMEMLSCTLAAPQGQIFCNGEIQPITPYSHTSPIEAAKAHLTAKKGNIILTQGESAEPSENETAAEIG